MQYPIAMALLVASVPIIVALCRAIGPGRAAPYAILGAFLLLARYNPDEKLLGIFTIDKLTVAGLSLAIGVLLFDRQALARARPHWVDLPMLLYVVAPLIGALSAKATDVPGAFDQSWLTFAEWGVPYAMGRLYYADREGARRLAIAVVVAGLLYIPFCFYEMAMGKDWFLRSLLFKIPTWGAYRLGGWRPVVMLTSGLELVSWMALATIMATWLWACRERWRMKYLPAWLPPAALLVTTVACRGAYGYAILGLGLASIGLLVLTRSRWVLAPLLLIPLAYISLRATGAWDGRDLIRLAQLTGERAGSSVGLRIDMENAYIRESIAHDPIFGLGGLYWHSWADGWWLTLLKRGGLFALAAHYSAFLLPAALFIFRRHARSPLATAEAGLALFIVLHMVDSLHNTPLIAVTTLLGGSLAGSFLAETGRARAKPEAGPAAPSKPSTAGPGHATYRLSDLNSPVVEQERADVRGPVVSVLAVACLLYVFGHAEVAGQEGAKFIGGLGSALLFASVGASVAGSRRRSLARVAAFGLAFAALGITFNLALHPSNRPAWSADILQGMALSGVVAACWRRLFGGGPWAFAGLAALAASWWAFGSSLPTFPGSHYFHASTAGGSSLFPVLPWLALTALGAILARVSVASCAALAVAFGISAALGWGQASPFGPPVKFPLNPTYAMLGASLASAAFAVAGPSRRWKPASVAGEWLGRRWLVFFYVHLGFAAGLKAAGLTQPLACWASLALLSTAATWMISEVMGRLRSPFRRPLTWVALGGSTLAIGLVPGVPPLAVLALAGVLGLAFASRYDDLAGLMLGPVLAEPRPQGSPGSEGNLARYLARVALIIAVLAAPELLRRLPAPFGTARAGQSGGDPRTTTRTEGH